MKRRNGYFFKPTLNERKAMEKEIRAQIAENNLKNAINLDALILYILNTEFGFGSKRLRKFFNCFEEQLKALVDYYQLDDDDQVWICKRKLKEKTGIDIDEWESDSNETASI